MSAIIYLQYEITIQIETLEHHYLTIVKLTLGIHLNNRALLFY